jgi:transcriptional regulator with XRE-family HTH domain
LKTHPVKVALAEQGLTQRQLADDTGYKPATVGLVVNGHVKPWPEFRHRVSERLGKSERELFRETES